MEAVGGGLPARAATRPKESLRTSSSEDGASYRALVVTVVQERSWPMAMLMGTFAARITEETLCLFFLPSWKA